MYAPETRDVKGRVLCAVGRHDLELRHQTTHGQSTGHEHTHYWYGCKRCPADFMYYTPLNVLDAAEERLAA